jgi:hypothetical protein
VYTYRVNIEKHLPYGPVTQKEAEEALGMVQMSFSKDGRNPFLKTGGNVDSDLDSDQDRDGDMVTESTRAAHKQKLEKARSSETDGSEQESESENGEPSSGSDISDGERLRELYDATFDQAQSMTSDAHREIQMNLIDAEIEDERKEEQALEDYDGKVGVQEEAKLRAILDPEHEESMADAKGKETLWPTRMRTQPKTEAKLMAESVIKPEHSNDWREWTDYRPPWEIHALIR